MSLLIDVRGRELALFIHIDPAHVIDVAGGNVRVLDVGVFPGYGNGGDDDVGPFQPDRFVLRRPYGARSRNARKNGSEHERRGQKRRQNSFLHIVTPCG